MRKLLSTGFLIVVSIMMILAFQNCSINSGRAEVDYPSSFIADPVIIKESDLVKTKTNQDDQLIYLAGSLLSVEIDLVCVRYQGAVDGSLTAELMKNVDETEGTFLNLTWQLKQDRTEKEIEEIATSDTECVFGISNESMAKVNSFAEDIRRLSVGIEEHMGTERANRRIFNRRVQEHSDILVAVLDTGVDYEHQDLINVVAYDQSGRRMGRNFTAPDPTDPNGVVDPSDFRDRARHGSQVSGVIAADWNNNSGIRGLASQHVKILPIKVMNDNGIGVGSWISNGIRYAADRGAHVINLSLSMSWEHPMLEDAILYAISKGTFVVASAGNQSNNLEQEPVWPATFSNKIEGFVSVAALDVDSVNRTYSVNNEDVAYYSNYGEMVELAAPGHFWTTNLANTYSSATGTSFAAPAVSAGVALYLAYFSETGLATSPARMERILRHGSRRNSKLDGLTKWGRELHLNRLSRRARNRLRTHRERN